MKSDKVYNYINSTKKSAFTLAEILITLGIIGVVAALTIPTLVQNNQEKSMVTGLLKFNSVLQQAVLEWKNDTSCYSDAYTCLLAQGADNDTPAEYQSFFESTIGKNMKIIKKRYYGEGSVDWLPDCTKSYGGVCTAGTFVGEVSNNCTGMAAYYLLADGTTFAFITDTGSTFFDFVVDVNGKKPPNRIGKDSYRIMLGGSTSNGKDFRYCKATGSGATGNATGLCSCSAGSCNPNNIDPTQDNGAMPTSYVLLNKEIPDYY